MYQGNLGHKFTTKLGAQLSFIINCTSQNINPGYLRQLNNNLRSLPVDDHRQLFMVSGLIQSIIFTKMLENQVARCYETATAWSVLYQTQLTLSNTILTALNIKLLAVADAQSARFFQPSVNDPVVSLSTVKGKPDPKKAVGYERELKQAQNQNRSAQPQKTPSQKEVPRLRFLFG